MKRIDSFYEYLGSDAECSFAEWLQRREAEARRRHTPEPAVVMPLGLTYALGIFALCVVAAGLVMTKAGGLW